MYTEKIIGTDSLKKRYIYKLFTNLVGLAINMVAQTIIPRGLGPKAYGEFNYLTNFFSQVLSFFDMGTTNGFFTKLSQRSRESSLVSFYLYFGGIISILVMLFVAVAQAASLQDAIWPGQTLIYIYMAAIFGIMTWISQVLNQMIDAYGLTIPGEKLRMLQRIIGLPIIVALFMLNRLDLTNFFYYHFAALLLLIWIFIKILKKNDFSIIKGWRLSPTQILNYGKEFYTYSHPLFVLTAVGVVSNLFDRWLLQKYSGSIQQGFYGLSYQIGGLCFLFTSALTPLIMREFSIAFSKTDFKQMAYLFRRYIPLFYSITAFFSCFIAFQADKIIYIIGGNKYYDAETAVTIMAFYPIPQTYGQLSGSVFFATGQTELYRNIGVIFSLIGIPLTFFLIAPRSHLGLDTGATGLAVKMLALNFLSVNVLVYFNTRLLKLSFWKYLVHQLVSVLCLLLIAAAATIIFNRLFGLSGNKILNFLFAGMAYSLMTISLIYLQPVIFGLKRDDIQTVIQMLRKNKPLNQGKQ